MHKENYSVAASLFAPNSANKKMCFAPTEAFSRCSVFYIISQAAGQKMHALLCSESGMV